MTWSVVGFKSKKIRVNLNLPIKAETKAESTEDIGKWARTICRIIRAHFVSFVYNNGTSLRTSNKSWVCFYLTCKSTNIYDNIDVRPPPHYLDVSPFTTTWQRCHVTLRCTPPPPFDDGGDMATTSTPRRQWAMTLFKLFSFFTFHYLSTIEFISLLYSLPVEWNKICYMDVFWHIK